MALVELNTINVDKGVSNDFYSEIILYPLMTDSGPNGYTLISSLDELKSRFQPSHITDNWAYAEYLLSMGYRLLIAKLMNFESYLSLRIFESHDVIEDNGSIYKEITTNEVDPETGLFKKEIVLVEDRSKTYKVPTTYSHPKRYVDYSKIELPWKYGNRDSIILPNGFTYSVKIPFPEKFYVGDYIFITQKHDIERNITGQLNRMIAFGKIEDFQSLILAEVASDIVYIDVDGVERSDIIDKIEKVLNNFNIYKEYEDYFNKEDDFKEVSCFYSTSLFPIQYNTTCKYTKIVDGNLENDFRYILNNKSGSFDLICEYADDYKLVDFYSKESLSVDYVNIEILKNFDDNFSIFITIRDNQGKTSKSEYFRVSMNPKSKIFISDVLRSSEIVDCVWYKEGDISGKFQMKSREDGGKTTFGEMLECLKSLPKLEDGDFDIIVDAGLDLNFQNYLYDTYKDFMCVKLFQLKNCIEEKDEQGEITNVKLEIPNNRRFGVLYCNKYFSLGNIVFPLWMGILALMKYNNKFSGDLNIGFLVDPIWEDKDGNVKTLKYDESDDYLCTLKFDGYRHMIPSTPIYMGESTYSLDLIWILTLIRNRVIPSINPQLSQDDFIRKFNSLVRSLLNIKSTRVKGVMITGYQRDDRYLRLEIIVIHDSDFVDSISLELTIKIN